jgi:cell division septal protein FtsQ
VLVDGDGRVVAEGSLEGLPSLDVRAPAPGEQVPAAARTAVAVVAGLPSDLRREVAVAASTDRGVELELHDEIVVEWGDRTQSAAKAEALRVILAEAGRATIATIDVTVPRATTLTRDDGGR